MSDPTTPPPDTLVLALTQCLGTVDFEGKHPGGATGAPVPDPLLPGPWLVRWRDPAGNEHLTVEERNWQEASPPQGWQINPGHLLWSSVISWTPLWDLH